MHVLCQFNKNISINNPDFIMSSFSPRSSIFTNYQKLVYPPVVDVHPLEADVWPVYRPMENTQDIDNV